MEKEQLTQENNADLLQPLSDEQDEITPRSHLSKALTKKAKRNILMVIAGALALVVIGVLVGPYLIVRFSILLESDTKVAKEQKQEVQYVAPPLLDPLPSATNSAQIMIKGSADNAKKVKVYRNGRLTDTPNVKANGSFSTRVTLLEGKNEIKAKALNDQGDESMFSHSTSIDYSNKAPEVTIITPSEGQVFEKGKSPISVEGTSQNATRITVNGFQAIIQNSGDFSYSLPLKGGNNDITVIAIDDAGNKTEKKISVHYSE